MDFLTIVCLQMNFMQHKQAEVDRSNRYFLEYEMQKSMQLTKDIHIRYTEQELKNIDSCRKTRQESNFSAVFLSYMGFIS